MCQKIDTSESGANKTFRNAAIIGSEASLWVKSYRPIEPIAPPDVGCCSKIGHGFASLRDVANGQTQTFLPTQSKFDGVG